MVIAIVIVLLICFLLARLTSTTDKTFWRALTINIAILVFYNIVTFGCVSFFWRSGGEGIIPVFLDIIVTGIHLLVLLVMVIIKAVKQQKS